MEANDSQDVASALSAATPVAIANLGPELPVNSKTSGISTIIWPYSAVKGTYAFTLAEPDFRLRLKKGQVRVNFAGAAAVALGKCGLESGDEVVLSLEGAEWQAASADRRKSISGADIDWEVTFTNKLNIQVKLAATDQVNFISAAQAGHDEQPQSIPEPLATIEPLFTPVDLPEHNILIASPPRHKTPAKSSRIALLGEDELESPAFIKRARASYGSLFEDGYDIFDDDDDGTKTRRKRARFGRVSTSWRYTSKSPSPEPEMAESPPRERLSTPDIPVETEQPSAVDLNTRPATSSNSPTSPMQVDDSLQTDAAEILRANSPALSAEITPITAPTDDHGTRSATDSLFDPSGAESMEDAGPLSASWDMPPTSYSLGTEAHVPLVESNAGILPMEMPHGLSSMPHDASHMDIGLTGHPDMLHEIGSNMTIDYHMHEEHITGTSFPQPPLVYDHPTSDYPPLEPLESHQISSSIHYPDPSFDATQSGPFVASLAPNPFDQHLVPTSASERQSPRATTSSWTSANRPTHPPAEALRSRAGTSEGSTSEQPLVLDDSDNEEQSERGSQGARRTFVEDEDAEGEQEVNVEHSEDDEEVLDEPDDEAGDYDTMPHPADDEDDSHDEDLQIHKLEPEFDVPESEEDSDAEDRYDEDIQDMVDADEEEGEDAGAFDSQVEDEEGYDEEDEEERSDDDQDEEELEDEEDLEDEETASSPPRPPQRPPQPKAPAQPVVIDLLSSSEDEGLEEEDEEDDEVETTHNRHDTQEQDEEEEEEEENNDEGDIKVEESDEEGIEEDEMEQDDNDEDDEEDQSGEEEEDNEEEIEEVSLPIAAPQIQETGSVAAEASSTHDEDGIEIALATEYNLEEDEAEDDSMNEDAGDRAVNLETIASQATRASQLDVTGPEGERDSKENSDPSEVPPQETDTVSAIAQQGSVVETNDSIASHPENSEAAMVERFNQFQADDAAKDFIEQNPTKTVPESKLGNLDVSDGPLSSNGLKVPDVQQSDIPISSPPLTQMPARADSVLDDKVDEPSDIVMAGTEDTEVNETAQQLPTPLDTQIETIRASQVETELATSFESAEELHFSGVFDANEQIAVSTTTTITSQDLKAAPQPPDTSMSHDISQIPPASMKIDTEEIMIQPRYPPIAALPIEAVETPFLQSEDHSQADTYSFDQNHLQFNLDDELQASILEDYSQELNDETSHLEDTTFIKPQMPIPQSSPNEHRANTNARVSTPPRPPQTTHDSPDSDIGAQLVRATQPTSSQTEASPRARRLTARTRVSQRTPSPKPATPKVHSSPTESMKSPKQAKPMRIPMESSPEVEDHSVLLARTSFPNQTSAASSVKDDSSRLEDDSESMATIKLQLARHLRDELRDCYILEGLRYHLNKTVDVIAVVMMQPAEPQRTKAREYAMSFTITDHSIGPNAVMEVQFYRPHKETLPVVKPGDIILLRRFKVMSLTNKGFGLRTQPDGSSWAVFDREGEPAQIKGPPVEYDAKESIYVDCLREWHGLLGEKARARLERANARMIEAGGGKKK